MKLPVEVTVIPDLMSFSHRAVHEIRPSLGVPAENEERCPNTVLTECVENTRRRVGVGPIVERQRHLEIFGRQMTKNTPEHEAVAVKRAMYRPTEHRKPKCGRQDHLAFLEPSTPA